MHGNDRLGAPRNHRLDLGRIHEGIICPNIDQYRPCSCYQYAEAGRSKRHSWNDHFIAFAHVQRTAGKLKCVRAVRYANRVRNTAVFSEFLFEEEDIFAKNEVATI